MGFPLWTHPALGSTPMTMETLKWWSTGETMEKPWDLSREFCYVLFSSSFIHGNRCFLHQISTEKKPWEFPLSSPSTTPGARCHHSRQRERRRSPRSWYSWDLDLGTNKFSASFGLHFGGMVWYKETEVWYKNMLNLRARHYIFLGLSADGCLAGPWLGTLTKCYQNWSKVGHGLVIWKLDLSVASQIWYAEIIMIYHIYNISTMF